MLRNAYLLCEALRIKESVLLVGDTGSGKTSLCQLYAEATGRKLYVVTCHSGLESSDIIGSLTIKVAGYHKHFEWQDGLLTQALKNGGMFLLDEISLADDSILERVNSVLDSDSRSLVLYEKLSTNDDGSPEEVIAHPDFLFVATMNPSGDYGKRELSHALRNRFTEIWCANSNTHEHLKQILDHNIFSSLKTFFVNGKLFNTAQICLDLMSDIFDHQFLKQIHKYPCPSNQERDELYNSKAPDVEENVRRINRAILFNKPIMLEGPPGCGKSVSITHLASLYGKKVVRINFSQQTELSDLFGSYFPFPDENQDITFKWMNGPFLEAIINNNWILLDELNLACQTVLEGLNSCLDHRSEVYISELNKTYSINRAEIRIFAAQNPQSHESGRKGLPKSFLDRFIVLNIDNFSSNTLNEIAQSSFPQIVKPIISLNFRIS
ncbi:hypothetical protein MXB_648 [Myxobolus squamalis]|nr:hypothetical protein MXB_648 [Myxobolus squamalis]